LGSVASDVGLVVVGLQDVEMGAGFLAISATKEAVRYLILLSVIYCFVCQSVNYANPVSKYVLVYYQH
jgi:hypothetical protein